MTDNVSLQIEELYLKRGSYIEAFLEFIEKNEIYNDMEDLLEVIDKILYAKIKQEFKDRSYFPKGTENAKTNSLDEFFD